MITFWGQVALATLAVYALACWLISKLPSSKRNTKRHVIQDHGLHGSNRERAINQSFNWR